MCAYRNLISVQDYPAFQNMYCFHWLGDWTHIHPSCPQMTEQGNRGMRTMDRTTAWNFYNLQAMEHFHAQNRHNIMIRSLKNKHGSMAWLYNYHFSELILIKSHIYDALQLKVSFQYCMNHISTVQVFMQMSNFCLIIIITQYCLSWQSHRKIFATLAQFLWYPHKLPYKISILRLILAWDSDCTNHQNIWNEFINWLSGCYLGQRGEWSEMSWHPLDYKTFRKVNRKLRFSKRNSLFSKLEEKCYCYSKKSERKKNATHRTFTHMTDFGIPSIIVYGMPFGIEGSN